MWTPSRYGFNGSIPPKMRGSSAEASMADPDPAVNRAGPQRGADNPTGRPQPHARSRGACAPADNGGHSAHVAASLQEAVSASGQTIERPHLPSVGVAGRHESHTAHGGSFDLQRAVGDNGSFHPGGCRAFGSSAVYSAALRAPEVLDAG